MISRAHSAWRRAPGSVLCASFSICWVVLSPGPGAGGSTTQQIEKLAQSTEPGARLQALWARMVTARGTYEQPMLLDQFNSISRVESGADQKIGAESRRRYEDLVKELRSIQAELEKK